MRFAPFGGRLLSGWSLAAYRSVHHLVHEVVLDEVADPVDAAVVGFYGILLDVYA